MRKFKIEIKWAFIFIAMTLAWMALEKLVGLHDKHIKSNITSQICMPFRLF